MAKGGGLGGKSGSGGRAGVAARAINKSVKNTPKPGSTRDRRNRNNRNGRNRNLGGRGRFNSSDPEVLKNERLADEMFTKDTVKGLTPSLQRRLSAGMKRLGKKIMENAFKKNGRHEIQRYAEAEKARVHDMAKEHLSSEIDELYMSDSYGPRNALTKGGIYNGLAPGQQALLGEHAGPAMRAAASNKNARGIDIYNAGYDSHDAMDAIAQTLHDLADAYDLIMDQAQMFQHAVDQSSNDNN